MPRLSERLFHYAILISVAALLFFPNIGGPCFWDEDEGFLSETGREMLISGNLIVPHFNWEPSADKPPLFFWLQVIAYSICGVGEFSARLPSACAAIIACILTYELGRRLYNKNTGLASGIILSSAAIFCGLARYAHPEMILDTCAVLSFFCLWLAFEKKSFVWYLAAGTAMGLAVLTKGPIGLVLPSIAVVVFLVWVGHWRRLFDWRLALVIGACAAVSSYWYVAVSTGTDGAFLQTFWFRHNLQNFFRVMIGHTGPPYYYILAILIGFAPWSVFVPQAIFPWSGESFRKLPAMHKSDISTEKFFQYRFLIAWIISYFVFFSLAQSKLPHYIMPVFAPLAILLGRFFDGWHKGSINPPTWTLNASLVGFALMGMSIILAGSNHTVLLIATQQYTTLLLPFGEDVFESFVAGVALVLGALFFWLAVRRERRLGALVFLASTAVVSTAILMTIGFEKVAANTVPRTLIRDLLPDNNPDTRIACYKWFEPSLVFYSKRRIERFATDEQACQFLDKPGPALLMLSEKRWNSLKTRTKARVVTRRYDVLNGMNLLVIFNQFEFK